jgi:L-amino acid N-acyltransferase YncA
LLERLVAVSEAEGYWTLQAQMMAENHASLALHRKAGFRDVGTRERYGHLNGVWHDVVPAAPGYRRRHARRGRALAVPCRRSD